MSNANTQSTPARTETDYLGPVEIPGGSLYGINTARGAANLTVSASPIRSEPAFVRAFACCKWAAALANADQRVISAQQRNAIVQACRELVEGMHHEDLVIDFMEGSGGTSTNMNFNEVIANRAQQLLGGELGRYDKVHPNDHVNRSQSTNDVYPSAMKMAAHALLAGLVDELRRLATSFAAKASEFESILHLGRTCLQDAQPMTLGQPFRGYGSLAARLADELAKVRDQLRTLPLGGTAIGTGFGSDAGYKQRVFAHLASITGTEFEPATDPFDAMQNLDVFCRVSAELRTAATSLGKVASDLILMSSGPHGGLAELELPAVQAGSSIMPGKVNPVVPMSIVQIGFAVVGNDVLHRTGQPGRPTRDQPLRAGRRRPPLRLDRAAAQRRAPVPREMHRRHPRQHGGQRRPPDELDRHRDGADPKARLREGQRHRARLGFERAFVARHLARERRDEHR